MIRHLGFAALFLFMGFLSLTVLAGCSQQQAAPPELRTWGVFQPTCVLFCDAAVETVDGQGDGSLSAGGISQTLAGGGGGI